MVDERSEMHRRMKKRNYALGGALLAFVLLVFIFSLAKMKLGG